MTECRWCFELKIFATPKQDEDVTTVGGFEVNGECCTRTEISNNDHVSLRSCIDDINLNGRPFDSSIKIVAGVGEERNKNESKSK